MAGPSNAEAHNDRVKHAWEAVRLTRKAEAEAKAAAKEAKAARESAEATFEKVIEDDPGMFGDVANSGK